MRIHSCQRSSTLITIVLCVVIVAGAAYADTLRLKNGSTLQGVFLGADTRQIRFMGPDGMPKAFSITSIAGVDFGGSVPSAAPRAAPRPQAPPPRGMSIPADTQVTVRMIDGIDSKVTGAGERFRCSIDDPIVVGNQVVVTRGADCTVQITQVESGKELGVKLYDITIHGKAYDAVSNYAQLKAQGPSKGRRAARRAALLGGIGAGIGALADGGQGAAIGATAGAGLGAISGAAAKGKHLKVPSETRLTFVLRVPLPLG